MYSILLEIQINFFYVRLQASNGVLVTDGAGKIRRTFADVDLQLDSQSDLVQFRLNGAKGILLKVDDLDDEDFARQRREKMILLRPSNLKFTTSSYEFGCVRQSLHQGNFNQALGVVQ